MRHWFFLFLKSASVCQISISIDYSHFYAFSTPSKNVLRLVSFGVPKNSFISCHQTNNYSSCRERSEKHSKQMRIDIEASFKFFFSATIFNVQCTLFAYKVYIFSLVSIHFTNAQDLGLRVKLFDGFYLGDEKRSINRISSIFLT